MGKILGIVKIFQLKEFLGKVVCKIYNRTTVLKSNIYFKIIDVLIFSVELFEKYHICYIIWF